MTLGEFAIATKNLPPSTELYVTAVGDPNNEGVTVNRVIITVGDDGDDLTIAYNAE